MQPRMRRLGDLLRVFGVLGFTAFGGPAAHIALFEAEVVRRRKWMTHQELLDLLGVVNLIPGPNSTQMVMYIGRLRSGVTGMFVAGLAFILPAAAITCFCAWVYVHFGHIPQVEGILLGVKPVVIAIILQALWGLGGKAVKSPRLGVLAFCCALAAWLGAGELVVLMLAGAVTAGLCAFRRGPRRHLVGLGVLALMLLVTFVGVFGISVGLGADVQPFSIVALFLFFFKVGGVLYGSGYVLLAFIESGLVNQWAWISQGQLLDAVAIGQVTPGPLFTTATFIGYILAGFSGAAVATIGIFLPSFILVGLFGLILPKLRASILAGAFLDGINAAALALMGVVTLQLGIGTLRDPLSILIALTSGALLLRFKVNATWLILAGALIGLVVSALK